MAMTLAHAIRRISFRGVGSAGESAFVTAEPHRRALVDDLFLLLHHVYHRMLCLRIEFRAVRADEFEHVARVLDHRDLQAEAETVIRNFIFPRITRRRDFAFGTTIAETAGNEN